MIYAHIGVAVGLLAIVAVAIVKGIKYMLNQTETDKFAELEARIDTLKANHATELAARDATIADLKAQLAAVPPPVVDNTPDVVAAIEAVEAKL